MKDDKKKLIVVIALAVVIVGVGAFQFISGSSQPPAPAPAAKKEAKNTPAEPKVDAPKNPLFSASLPARDPFQQVALPNSIKPTAQPQPQPSPQPEMKQRPLPPVEISGAGGFGNAPVTIQAEPEAKFGFMLSGVMMGQKPMAVFTDAQGNQRLVMLGGSLDPETKVISIDKDAVTVRFHGKTLRLTVEGNPNAK